MVERVPHAIAARGRERGVRARDPGRGLALIADADREARTPSAAALRRIGFAVWEAATGARALELARRQPPLFAVLEVRLPDLSGFEVAVRLREDLGTRLPIIFTSGDRTEPMDRVVGLLLGADDYLVKPINPDELLARTRALLRRAGALRGVGLNGSDLAGKLTRRECEILGLLARGLSQVEIARELSISPGTVGAHVERVFSKLGVHSRAQAVALAHHVGLVRT